MMTRFLRAATLVFFAMHGAVALAGGPPLICPTIAMAPTSLPNGDLATAYTPTVTSSGGTAPVAIDITHGVLPTGVNLTDNGDGTATFSGTSTQTGAFEFTITATDVNGCSGGRTYATTFATATSSTALALTTGPNPSVFGQTLTFTATVTSGSGTPAGNVTFKDGAATLGTVALSGGVATFTTSTLTVGTHSPITAVYAGNATFAGSTSNPLSQTVTQAATTTTLVADINPSAFGQSVTFTATVSAVAPGAGTPTGTVTFFDGVINIGSGPLSGSGVATLSTGTLTVGAHQITATYGADTNFSGSTSNILTQTVNQAATTTALVSGTNPSVFGQSVTFTATVTATAPGAGTPTGTVTFLDGVTPIGSGPLNGSGVATLTTSTLAVGSHPISASYSSDVNFGGSTGGPLSQVVNQAATSTALFSSINPSAANQSVTFTAIVTATAPGAGTPTGTANFFDGVTNLGPGTLNGSGQATFTTSTLSVGGHSITATYNGDVNFSTSTSAPLTQTVNLNPSTTTLVSSVNPTVFGQSTTFTATVTGTGTPTGTVAFMEGPTLLGTGPLVAGAATFSTSALAVGPHVITAVYSGDSNFATSTSGPVVQTVNQAATTTEVGSSVNPSVFGQSVTFTATVAPLGPGAGTPTGTVTFKDGAAVLGAPVALNGSGQATFTTSALAIGPHQITATYSGDANFLASDNTASPWVQLVNQAATTTTLGTSGSPSVFGQSVTFTATVSPVAPGAGTPTGTVQFKDGAANLGAPVSLAGGVATFNTSSLTVSTHSITAVYSADTNFTASTSSALSQAVNKAATTTVVVSSQNPSVSGQSVTFTATVTATAPGAGTPTGNVDFKDGATTIGSGALAAGVATFTTTTLSVATHSITAVYTADANFNGSTSSALSQTVNKAPTTTTVVSSLNPSVFQNSVTFTATVTSTSPGTLTGSVNFFDGVTNIGSGAVAAGVATFTTTTLTGGTHSITAVYSGDANFATSTSSALSQVVNKAPQTITFTAPPAFVATNTTFTATATATSGLTVTFSIDGTSTSGCSVAGTTVTTGATTGTCVINANQAGDGNWLAATQVQRSTTVLVPANADADSDTVTGNVAINVPVGANSVLTGDTGTNIAIISYGVLGTEQTTIGAATPTTKGGSVSLNADGSYSYSPPANFTGTGANADTFKYRIDNALNQPSTGTVTLTVSDRIMIVATAGVGAANCKPATACMLATADAALAVTAGKDLVFVQSGAYASATFSLLNNQAIVGQQVSLAQALTDVGITLAPDSVTPAIAAGARPTLTNAATILTLGGGNLIEYFNLNPSAGAAISGAAAVTGTTTANTIVITSSGTSNAIALVSQAAGHTFNLDSASSITHSSNAAAISLTGAGGQGPVSIAAPISSTSGSPVTISGRTAGTVAFTGAVSSTGQGISLTGNTGSTINFSAGVNLSTGANDAFTATGGGTVIATQNNTSIVNVLTATTGTALNVANTTIGAGGLTFRSITSNGSSNNTGIILDNTGATAGLTVTGNGGTCTSAATCTGGTISNKTGANTTTVSGANGTISVNAGTPIGVGIFLRSTRNVSLTRMQLNDFSNYGVLGASVVNFTLDNSVVNGTSGDTTNAPAPPEGSIFFSDLTGNAAITNSTVTNTMPQNSTRITDTIHVMNNGGTLTLFNIDTCTIANISPVTNPGGKDAIFFGTPSGLGSGAMNLTINNTNITAAFQFLTQVNVQGSASSIVNITNSHFTDTNENFANGIASAGGGVNLTGGGTDVYVKYLIQNNTFQHNSGANPGATNAGALLITGIASQAGTFDGRIVNNTFGATGVLRSGAGNAADALRIFASGNNGSNGNTKVLVQGNSIKRWGETGIQFNARQGNAKMDITVLNNVINEPGTAALGAFAAIWANVGALPADTNTMNIAIGGTNGPDKNTMQDSDPSNATDVFLDRNSCGGCASILNVYRNGSAAGGAGEALVRQILVDDNIPILDLLAGFTNGSTIGIQNGLPPQPSP